MSYPGNHEFYSNVVLLHVVLCPEGEAGLIAEDAE